MKKRICIIIVLATLVMSFASCGAERDESSTDTAPIEEEKETVITEAEYYPIGESVDDYPNNITFWGVNVKNAVSIPNEGTYLIRNKTLMKYYKGERILIDGGKLQWNGFDPQAINMYELTDEEYEKCLAHIPVLVFDPSSGKLVLITYSLDCDEYVYIYSFPDYNKSEIEFVGVFSPEEVSDFFN